MMKRHTIGRLAPGAVFAALVLAPQVAHAQGTPPAPPAPGPGPADTPPSEAPKKPDQPQAPGMEGEKGETVATTRFVEAYTVGDWEKAEKYYHDLVDNWPIYRQEPTYVYKYSFVLFKLGSPTKKAEAADQLQALLERDSENIMAMYLLAQIKAGMDKPQAKEEAKELLLNAARHGFYTIREITNSKQPEFNYLRTDPKFILRAMRATQEFIVVDMRGARNPFELPVRFVVHTPGEEAGGGTLDPRKLAELETRIEGIFAEIDKLAKEQKVEELIPKFAELDQIMRDFKKIGREKVEQKLKQWDKRLEEWKEIRLAIKLQMYINEGNEYLKAMVKAKQQERFDDVFENFTNIKVLVDKMKHEEREEYHRNADAIFVRGEALNKEAQKLKKIKEFNLIVTGIVLDPRPEGRNRAIVVFDDPDKRGRIYEENDEIRNREDKRVDGLKIVKIVEGSIKFKYEDTEFIRELKSP
jgi:hypothetical protein